MALRRLLWLVLLVCTYWSCNQKERKIEPAFYYWKQNFTLNSLEQNYVSNLKIKTIYIKFFDINKGGNSEQAEVIAPIRFSKLPPKEVIVVPTVYVTNNTLKGSAANEIPQLADLIWSTTKEIIKKNKLTNVKGMQLDCDWSLSTRGKYFSLLKLLKEKLANEELSATIRLHQVKFYEKTGIPPVDRGALMFYNMDDVRDETTKNSILDLEIAKQYFVNFDKYTLPLDVALPMFSWGVVRRRGRVVELMNHLKTSDLTDTARYEMSETANHFIVKQSHYLNAFYLYKDDIIRLERVSNEDLMESARLLNSHVPRQGLMNLIFYHLDSAVLNAYPIEDTRKIIEIFE